MPEETLKMASKCLEDSDRPEIRKIKPSIEGDCLVLRGEVTTFYSKQLAQSILQGRVNGYRILNEVIVRIS